MKKEDTTIKYVEENSYAYEAGLEPGDKLLTINGNDFRDVLEYRYLLSEPVVTLEVEKKDKTIEIIEIENDYEDIGLVFPDDLIGDAQSCTNKCIFCFIDQLPKGMRETVYFKDDDTRLSFLQGNYVTLTNMSDEVLDRIIKMHVSPINVSVHTTNPKLREMMLHNRFAGKCYSIMQRFAKNHIYMNCQIVLCPGINDRAELDRTISDLSKLYPYVESVSAVPVGLTRYREGLCELTPYTKETSKEVIDQVSAWQEKLLKTLGTRLIYLSDEFYINAGVKVPDSDTYEGFPQIENGVGLVASMREEFYSGLKFAPKEIDDRYVALVTGEMVYDFIKGLCDELMSRYQNLKIDVQAIRNDFFGGGVSVTGLVCGGDIINQLKTDAKILFIPDVMLRDNDMIFLDDVEVYELEEKLNVKVYTILNDGYDFIEKIIDKELEF